MPRHRKPIAESPVCRKCQIALTAYSAVPGFKEKRKHICKICNRSQQRDVARRLKYGMGQEDYDLVLLSQGNKCAICRSVFAEHTNRVNVDHCHESGYVRGFLCNGCNTGLGCFKDNRHFLANAIRYLQHNHSPGRQPPRKFVDTD